MRKVETGKFYGTKSVKEADVNEDNSTALAALLALASADVQQGNKDAALKNLERCEPLLTNAPGNLVEEYESYKHRIADIKESPS
ncbi:hypothetical protein SK128_023115 [Halocaridina rubra]|uniref:Tetratricopeptide repeat protein n=1 Tax=Halocaridina rubra TaxID=373956 RepID=A0AAN9AAW0_HALRR